MSEEKLPVNEKIEVMMQLDELKGRYANFLRISHSKTDFVMDFCMQEGPHAHTVSRIIVNAISIKAFVTAIQKNIERFESNFNIELPGNADDFIQLGVVKKS